MRASKARCRFFSLMLGDCCTISERNSEACCTLLRKACCWLRNSSFVLTKGVSRSKARTRAKEKREGDIKVDGVNGVNGFNGFDGFNGFNGVDGFNGFNGVDGFDGVNGVDGDC